VLVLIQQIIALLSPTSNTCSSKAKSTKALQFHRQIHHGPVLLHTLYLAAPLAPRDVVQLGDVPSDAAAAVTTVNTEQTSGSEIAMEEAERSEREKALIPWFLQVPVSGVGCPSLLRAGTFASRDGRYSLLFPALRC